MRNTLVKEEREIIQMKTEEEVKRKIMLDFDFNSRVALWDKRKLERLCKCVINKKQGI